MEATDVKIDNGVEVVELDEGLSEDEGIGFSCDSLTFPSELQDEVVEEVFLHRYSFPPFFTDW